MSIAVITLREPLPIGKAFYKTDLLEQTVLQAESQIAELDPAMLVEVHYATPLRGVNRWHKFTVYAHEFGKYMGETK